MAIESQCVHQRRIRGNPRVVTNSGLALAIRRRQSDAIRYNRWQSEPIRANLSAMRGNQRQIVAIGCNRRQSEVKQRLGGVNNRKQSDAIRANHSPQTANQSQSETMSEAIKSNQFQSDGIRGKSISGQTPPEEQAPASSSSACSLAEPYRACSLLFLRPVASAAQLIDGDWL